MDKTQQIKETIDDRIEKDLIGEMKVPKDAYYGIQTMRALTNFPITGDLMDTDFINAMAIVKKAAARANMETGHLDEKLAKTIMDVADEILAGKWHQEFPIDPVQGGAGTSANMNMNEVIANRGLELLGEEKGNYGILSPNVHVNMAQSTNDGVPTAANLAILTKLMKFVPAMEELHVQFMKKADEFDGFVKMGRTHIQDAVPIRLGQEFKAFALMLGRDILRVKRAMLAFYSVNMGATAVGTGLNADVAYIEACVKHLAEYSGFPIVSAEDLVDATANTDTFLELSSALKNCAMNMNKVCRDLRLMTSGPRCGLGEIKLPERQPGSSIMPGKVNPVMAEVMVQIGYVVAGNDLTISMACEGGDFQINVMKPVILYKILDSLKVMTNGFGVFSELCISGIEANIEQMAHHVSTSAGAITALNPHIGYQASTELVQEVISSGRSIKEVVLEKGLLTEEELNIIFNPYEMTNPGIAGKELLKK